MGYVVRAIRLTVQGGTDLKTSKNMIIFDPPPPPGVERNYMLNFGHLPSFMPKYENLPISQKPLP